MKNGIVCYALSPVLIRWYALSPVSPEGEKPGMLCIRICLCSNGNQSLPLGGG